MAWRSKNSVVARQARALRLFVSCVIFFALNSMVYALSHDSSPVLRGAIAAVLFGAALLVVELLVGPAGRLIRRMDDRAPSKDPDDYR